MRFHAGGSPRAASPPLERATSAPVFEDHMSVDGGNSSSGDEAQSPAAPALADAGAALHRRHVSVVSSGNGNGRAGSHDGSLRTRSWSRPRPAAALALDPAADGGFTSEHEFMSVSISHKLSWCSTQIYPRHAWRVLFTSKPLPHLPPVSCLLKIHQSSQHPSCLHSSPAGRRAAGRLCFPPQQPVRVWRFAARPTSRCRWAVK